MAVHKFTIIGLLDFKKVSNFMTRERRPYTHICTVYEPTHHTPLASDTILSHFSNVEVWLQSLELSGNPKPPRPAIEGLIYTEPDGYRWYWRSAILTEVPEAF